MSEFGYMKKSGEPLIWDFQTIEYDASSNPINVRCYATVHQGEVASITNNTGTITVTTSDDHDIVIPWSGLVTYGIGTRVSHAGRYFVSQKNANLNNSPIDSLPDGNANWLQDDSYVGEVFTTPVVAISGVTGMTDLNGKFTVVSTPTAKSFIVTLSTAQVYVSGGSVKAGVFQFRKHMKYSATNDVIEVEILYT